MVCAESSEVFTEFKKGAVGKLVECHLLEMP